jgi:hypothetical protein
MSKRIEVVGRPAEGIYFENPPKFCPQCGGDKLEPKRWYSREGDMLMAECAAHCGCHFGVSGWNHYPAEEPCAHEVVAGIEADGVTRSAKDRCLKCGADA